MAGPVQDFLLSVLASAAMATLIPLRNVMMGISTMKMAVILSVRLNEATSAHPILPFANLCVGMESLLSHLSNVMIKT